MTTRWRRRSALLTGTWLLCGAASGCSYDLGRVWTDGGAPLADRAVLLADRGAPLAPDGRPPDGARPDAAAADLAAPDLPVDAPSGRWYQADGAFCPVFCADRGELNVGSAENAACMSGEVRPASGLDQGIQLTFGCTGGCGPQGPAPRAVSYDEYCYRDGQKQDWDDTDVTVGCFCR